MISCHGPESLDLTNLENEVITFYNEPAEEINFPSMNIITDNNQEIVDDPKINAELIVLEDEIETKYNIGIEIRGSSSQSFPKKSYGFETKTSDYSDDLDVSIGGFTEEEDWILYGPYSDKSLIRNKLTFDLSNAIGFKASNTKFYNLSINGDGRGLYVLMEKIKRDSNRVDISKNNSESVDAGYIIKIDKPTGDGESCSTCYDSSFSFRSNFDTNGNESSDSEIYFVYDYPKPKNITEDQKQFIFSIINEFESILASDNFDDPIDGFEKVIDVDTFIDFFIMNEITKNPDGFRLSTYMNRDSEGKLKMGPIWDFNLAFGNVDYCDGMNPEGWIYNFNSICPSDIWQVPFWWRRLMESPSFKNKLKDRWLALRSNILSDPSIDSRIDAYLEYLNTNKVIDQNFYRWTILGQYVWPNYFVGSTHESEINFLKNWIDQRLNWMDGQINNF
ncbi:MAG: CotH kinase family protein [Flavobacteriaceae bacterium]|nr:CotH kinase family protein [Flavobacteriaceae bacterium]